MNVERTTEIVFSDPWEEYYEKQNAQTEQIEQCIENYTVDNSDNVQIYSEQIIHVDHESAHTQSEQMQSQWHDTNSNNNQMQIIEHECAYQMQDDSHVYHEQQYESHSEHHHQHTPEQSTHSIIESTNQSFIPAEIVSHECIEHSTSSTHEIHDISSSNDNFVSSSSQNIDDSEPSGNNNDDQVRKLFLHCKITWWNTATYTKPKKKNI